jgi:hypothetical protein
MDTADFSRRFMEMAAKTMDDATFASVFSPDGLAPTATWSTEDDWIVEYTTKRIRAGKLDGLFATMVFKPKGRGSKRVWERVKLHRCATRREAKQLALRYYYEHSPRTAARHGWNGSGYER